LARAREGYSPTTETDDELWHKVAIDMKGDTQAWTVIPCQRHLFCKVYRNLVGLGSPPNITYSEKLNAVDE
jgi:hypothetical protein